MLAQLNKFKNNKKASALVSSFLKNEVLKMGQITESSFVIFSVPVVNCDKNNLELALYDIHVFQPNYAANKKNDFLNDNKHSLNLLKLILKDHSDEDFLLGYGSCKTGFTIDGVVSNAGLLKDYGLSILNSYYTLKREELFNSKEFIDAGINDFLEDLSLNPSFESFNVEKLKSYIDDLKMIIKDPKIVKLQIDRPSIVSSVIREPFYKRFNDEIESGKFGNIDLFLSISSFLNYIGIIKIEGIHKSYDYSFNFFNDLEAVKALNRNEYTLNVGFQERFLKIYSNQ